MNKRQAIAEVRASADAIIDQLTRWANGWDKGAYRDDTLSIDRCWMLPAKDAVIKEAENAFSLSAMFQG